MAACVVTSSETPSGGELLVAASMLAHHLSCQPSVVHQTDRDTAEGSIHQRGFADMGQRVALEASGR